MRTLLASLSVLFGAASALAADPVNPPAAAFAHRLPPLSPPRMCSR